jgi:hypothetical protein
VEDEIKRLTSNYIHNLPGHPNVLTSHLLAPPPLPQRSENDCTGHGQQTYLVKGTTGRPRPLKQVPPIHGELPLGSASSLSVTAHITYLQPSKADCKYPK